MLDLNHLDQIIKNALNEDIGYMDITTVNVISESQRARGVLIARENGVVAGLNLCQRVFALLSDEVNFNRCKNEGETFKGHEILAELTGPARAILTGERVALNFLQRLSGIAAKTFYLSELIKPYKCQLVDTRKTTPGLRLLEKYAVRMGRGRNHRFGLYDGVMIKDNHIQIAGGISPAVSALKKSIPHTLKIEVEVETIKQLWEALGAGADIILLDNMPVETIREAVKINAGKALLEASGGITEENIVEVAKTGIDFISVGALTHSARSIDISLDIIPD
jgi:nicotinate-nucleotide pyrophosphorylase (carboxylating)